VHVGRDRETTDIGDLAVQAARRLAGRVVLEDGAAIPFFPWFAGKFGPCCCKNYR